MPVFSQFFLKISLKETLLCYQFSWNIFLVSSSFCAFSSKKPSSIFLQGLALREVFKITSRIFISIKTVFFKRLANSHDGKVMGGWVLQRCVFKSPQNSSKITIAIWTFYCSYCTPDILPRLQWCLWQNSHSSSENTAQIKQKKKKKPHQMKKMKIKGKEHKKHALIHIHQFTQAL